MQVRWASFDIRTGKRGAEVRTRKLGTAGRFIGEPTTTDLEVLCWDEVLQQAWPDWAHSSEPGRMGLVALDEHDNPLWSGHLTKRVSGKDVWVKVGLATVEAYLDRRYVGDHTFTGADLATIFTTLIGDATADGGALITVDAPATGLLHDRTYYAADDKTVLSAITELMGIQNGLEFTADPEWTDDTHTVLRHVMRTRPRLGVASTHPAVSFRLPGNITDFTYTEDYSKDHGANAVMATSSGEGETRPQSALRLGQLPSWPRYERRVTPSTSITEIATLNAHADAELAQTWDGLKELELTARLDETTHPALWSLGDDLYVEITAPRFPARIDTNGALVPGYTATIRAMGWAIDFDALSITPRVIELSEVPA